MTHLMCPDLHQIKVLINRRGLLDICDQMGSNDLTSADNVMANISQEGGAKLIYYLLSAAVQPSDGAGGDLPSVLNVCEWQY